MKKKLLLSFLTLIFFGQLCFAEGEISAYTEQKIIEFMETRARLKSSATSEEALSIIEEIQQETYASLPEHAVDYEQEKIILDNLYLFECYERQINPVTRAPLRAVMKEQMKKDHEFLKKRTPEQLSKYFYIECAVATSYYMTRSVAATIFYGFKVRDWHKMAVEKDIGITEANVCLANLYYYAPPPVGSSKKSRIHYKNALEGVRYPGEKYYAYFFYSQYLFEMGDKAGSKKYLDMAYDLGLGTKELDMVRDLNEKENISYLKYMRNRAGIDEKMPENEKDEND